MSLNSVVNNLVRAAASIPADISDAELDRHVAALLAEEAKAKEVKWSELGLGAWTGTDRDSPDPNAPKPNKRFLAAVIKNVDGHNRDLLRSQAEAARDIRRSRGEENMRGSSSKRLRGRLFGGAMAGLAQNGSRKGKERERERERKRDTEGWEDRYFSRAGEGRDGDSMREEMVRSRYYDEDDVDDRRRSYRRRDEDKDDRERRKRRDRSYEHDSEGRSRHSRREREGDDRDRRKHDRSTSPEGRQDRKKEREFERERAERLAREKRYERYPDSDLDSSTSRGKRTSPIKDNSKANEKKRAITPPPPLDSPAPSPSPPPVASPISKMDKYFNTSYDPRLDLGEVPREGMIVNVGWDNMLAVLKERGKKKRVQSPGLSPDPYDAPAGLSLRSPSPDVLSRRVDKSERKKRKEDRKRRQGLDSDSEDEREKRREKKRKEKERESHLAPASAGTLNGEVLSMEYTKKGGTREWDKGK